MKASLFVVLALLALAGLAVEVPAPSPTSFDDTEVSTKFTFAVGGRSHRRLVRVTRRGLGVSSETVSFSLVESGFGLTIR